MGSQNYLGIYISKNTATVVCIDSQVKDGSVLGCFSVMVDKQEHTNMQALANLIIMTEQLSKLSQSFVEYDMKITTLGVKKGLKTPKKVAKKKQEERTERFYV